MTYKDDVLNAFKQFVDLWDKWDEQEKRNQFWHVANSLDACVDLTIQASEVWDDKSPQPALQHLIADSYSVFQFIYTQEQGNKFKPGFWWDDYGWWGITFLKIYDHFNQVSDDAIQPIDPNDPPITREACFDVAKKSWQVMTDYAWHAANNSLHSPGNGPFRGPVDGGCWNNYPASTNRGIQNTVTNALYLTLSIRLFLTTGDRPFLLNAWNEFLWFKQWRGMGQFLFRYLDAGQTMAYERPYDPNYPDYNKGAVVPYVPGQMWTGDQGLLIAGLTGLWEARVAIEKNPPTPDPDFPDDVTSWAEMIMSGVKWLYDSDNVLHESILMKDFATTYLIDYATGKGVFSRYIAYATARRNLSWYVTQITETAKAALKFGYPPGPAPKLLSWNSKTNTKLPTNDTTLSIPMEKITGQITLQSARLDALVAAIPSIKNE